MYGMRVHNAHSAQLYSPHSYDAANLAQAVDDGLSFGAHTISLPTRWHEFSSNGELIWFDSAQVYSRDITG